MQSLSRAALRPDRSGTPLPTVYQAFARHGIHLRTGEVSLLAAPPGNGKSSLALDWARKLGVPSLYFSADSDAWTQAQRLAAGTTGGLISDVELRMEVDEQWAAEVLSSASHLRWCFDSAPTLGDIELELAAYTEVMGRPPELVVVDNLCDITHSEGGEGNEYATWKAILKELKWMARDSEASWLVLHHTNEREERFDRQGESKRRSKCPSRTDVSGKVSQHPAMVLTMQLGETPGSLYVCPVKNRHGKADPTGNDIAYLQFWPEYMKIGDF